MPAKNTSKRPTPDPKAIAKALGELATLMELSGVNPFKVRAHENAKRAIETGEVDVLAHAEAGTLGDQRGFGEAMVKKVTEFIETGTISELEELREAIPPGLIAMLNIPGLGPKKIQMVWKELGIETVDDLQQACEEHRLKGLKGFSDRTEQKIVEGIALMRAHAGQSLWDAAWRQAQAIVDALRKLKAVQRIEIAGSLRRRKEVVKDIDIVASSKSPEAVMDAFVALDGIEEVTGSGETKSSVRLEGGISCDLRVVTDEQFPFTLAHFTGSKEHNVAMRGRAQREFNWRVSEYGLFNDGEGGKLIRCKNEAALYAKLGLAFVPPELREDRGEIDAAEGDNLPELVSDEDLVGILHMHTTFSDGRETLETMVEACTERGFKWVGISDHSVTAAYAGGMKPDDVHRQFDEIEALNQRRRDIRVFKGIEVDILADGSVDYDEVIWERSDFLIASVHSNFTMPEKKMTERICRTLENPFVTILGHPTGRLLLQRKPYAVDLDVVIEAAAKHGRMIEINANPRRLDLDWRWVKRARDAGITLSIGPDAHSVPMLEDIHIGVGIARKGWLRRRDVLNCKTAAQAAKAFATTRE